MNVFEAVKQSVTTRQAAEHFGIRVGRNGMCVCPFHADKNPSMKVDRRFHCFGCQADGDVIDFVSRLEAVSPKEAALKVSSRIFYRKVRCGHCRLAMTRMEGTNPYYICQTYRRKPDIGCPQDKMSEKEWEQAVLASIRAMAQFVRKAEKARQRQSDKADRYNQRIEQKILAHENSIKMRQQEKMSAFENMVSSLCDEPEYKRRCNQCDEHIRRLEQKIRELQNEKRLLLDEKSPAESVLPYTNVRTLTRELVDLLIQHIYIYSDTSIEIVWKFQDEYKRLLAELKSKADTTNES